MILILSSDYPPMILCYFLNRSSIALRSGIEERTKDNRRMIEDRTKTERRPIEDLSRTNRRPIESRRHPERIPKEENATQYAKTLPKDTTFIQKSRHKTVKSIQKSRLTPVKQPEHRTTDCLRHITEQYLHDELRRGLHYQHIQTLQNFPEKYV